MVNTRGNQISHTKILYRILNTISLSKEERDSTYNLDPNFVEDIQIKEDYYTDGSKLEDNRTEAGVPTVKTEC